jgi:hypothetical protein
MAGSSNGLDGGLDAQHLLAQRGQAAAAVGAALQRALQLREARLGAAVSMAAAGGPIHASPASTTAWAKWAFSAKNP